MGSWKEKKKQLAYADKDVTDQSETRREWSKERELTVLNCQMPFGTRSQIFSVCSCLGGEELSALLPIRFLLPQLRAPAKLQRAMQPEEYHRNTTDRHSFTQFYQF